MSEYLLSMVRIYLNWLLDTWETWVIFIISVFAILTLYWYLFEQRTYKAIGSKAQIRHGRLGHWIDLEEHLQTHHETTK